MNILYSRTAKIIGAVLAVIVLAVIYFFIFIRQSSEYSIVYLSTGDTYVGHLSTFPRLTLTDGYILQFIKHSDDPSKDAYQLTPLKDLVWAPEYLYLNGDQVLFSGPFSDTSKVLQTINNPTPPTPVAGVLPPPSAKPATTTEQ
ncbi:hypothetical protein HY416_02565 [Candidatus Kaiserbacteria bacterium]|nr:hypothetical protein [Candidatus Kaiserbacteria bacterium]